MAHRGRHNADEPLAAALAAGRTVAEAAAAAGVSVRTAHRRRADPAFAQRVQRIQFETVQAASGRLSDSMAEAVGVIRGLLAHADPNVRLRAATRVVDLGVKVYERVVSGLATAAIQARLEDLEERLKRAGEPAP